MTVLALYLLLRIADIERIDQWLGISLSARLLRGWLEWIGLALLTIGAGRAVVTHGLRR